MVRDKPYLDIDPRELYPLYCKLHLNNWMQQISGNYIHGSNNFEGTLHAITYNFISQIIPHDFVPT
jgi:hypothetical protein